MFEIATQSALFVNKQIKLQKPTDWTVWLSFIRMIAENDNVWDLINSELATRSFHLSKPIELAYDEDIEQIDLKQYNRWKTKMGLHKTVMIRYEKQKEIFKQIIKQI